MLQELGDLAGDVVHRRAAYGITVASRPGMVD
jgi:hypothetical protein